MQVGFLSSRMQAEPRKRVDLSMPGHCTSPPGLPRVLVAHEQDLARAGITALLRRGRGACVIGATAEASQTLCRAQELHPDVALVSSRMLTDSGEPLLHALQGACPEVRLVAIVPRLGLAEVSEALRAGAAGVVDEGACVEVLSDAIRAAARGRNLLTGATAAVLLNGLEARGGVRLTPRQQQVLGLLAGRLGNAEIAARLGIRPATVRLHIRHILKRLGASTPMQAVSLAHQLGLVRPD
jgi:DNA-binding NarL/FixJ family response regulator